MAIGGQRRLMALFGGGLQALLAGITLLGGALQGRRVGVHMQTPALAIDQQRRARRQQQHRGTGTDQGWNSQGPRNNRAVSGGATAGGENTGDTGRIKARHIGRTDFVHHQNVGLLRFMRCFDTTELRQHSTADIAQIGGALGEQGVLQGLLLPGSGFDHRHPRRFRAFALLETGVDFIGQFRIVEHFLVGDENLADSLGLAAFDQAADVLAHVRQRLLEALTLDGGGLSP
ncbi:hypothetical protein D3C76_850290 [compost metagenome]